MGNQSGTLGADDPALVNVEGRKSSNSLSLPPHLRPGLHSPREMIAQVNAAHDLKESPRTPNADGDSARGTAPQKELDQLKTFMELKYKKDAASEMIGAVAGESGHPIRKHFAKRLNFYKELELVVGSNARRRSTLVSHIRPDPEAAAKDDDDNNDGHSTGIPAHMQEALANATGGSMDSTGSSKGTPPLEHQNSRSISLIDENGGNVTDVETDLETDTEAETSIAPSRSVSTGSDGGLRIDGDLIRNNTVVIDERKNDVAFEEKRKLKRQRVLGEIVDSEKLYYKFLVILCDKFYKPMSQFLTPEQLSSIFANITAMAPLHEIFAKELAAAPNITTVFQKYSSYLKIYTPYVNNYEKALATLSQLRNHKKYQEFTQKCRKDESIGGLDLTSFLIMPIQRIPRYRLLLEQLMKYTPEEDPESPALQDVLGRISSIAEQVNESKRQLEHMTTILAVQERISGDTQLFAPHRQLIREAALIRKKSSSKPIHMFLFNDIMLWTSPSPGYKFKGLIKLCTCTVKDYVHKNKIGFSVVNPAMPQDLTLVFATEAERDQWRNLILENIENAKLLNDNKRSRLHQRRNDMHNKIQSQLKNLSGTLKKRLMDKGFLAAAAAGDEAAVNAAIEAAEKAEADGTAQGVFGRVPPRGRKPPLAQANTGGSESSLTDDNSLVDYQEEHSITLEGPDSDDDGGVHTLARSDTSRRPGKAGHGGSGSDTDEDDPTEREKRLAQVRKEVKEQRDTPPPTVPATPQAAHHAAETLAATPTAPVEAKAQAETPPQHAAAPVPAAVSAAAAAVPEPATPPSASSTGSGSSAAHKRQASAGSGAEKKTTAASKPPVSRIPSVKSPPSATRQASGTKPQSPRVAGAGAGAGLSRTASRLGSNKVASPAAPAESAAAPAAKAASKAPPLPPRPGSKPSLPTKPPAVAPKPAPKPASAAAAPKVPPKK